MYMENGQMKYTDDDMEHVAKHMEQLEAQVAELAESRDWYKRRLDRLQREQEHFRDPERIMLCDIIANGHLLNDPKRYEIAQAKAKEQA